MGESCGGLPSPPQSRSWEQRWPLVPGPTWSEGPSVLCYCSGLRSKKELERPSRCVLTVCVCGGGTHGDK